MPHLAILVAGITQDALAVHERSVAWTRARTGGGPLRKSSASACGTTDEKQRAQKSRERENSHGIHKREYNWKIRIAQWRSARQRATSSTSASRKSTARWKKDFSGGSATASRIVARSSAVAIATSDRARASRAVSVLVRRES